MNVESKHSLSSGGDGGVWLGNMPLGAKDFLNEVVVALPLRLTKVNRWGKARDGKTQLYTISGVITECLCGKDSLSPNTERWPQHQTPAQAEFQLCHFRFV